YITVRACGRCVGFELVTDEVRVHEQSDSALVTHQAADRESKISRDTWWNVYLIFQRALDHMKILCGSMASTPPPLMKKHSQTDLVSRLKSRKVLGVGGEDDDGEVHRSKISQMLGNEIKFAVREPFGLRLWLLISAVMFMSTSLMALAFPNQLYEIIFELTTSRISIRLYGGALLCISLILWNGLYTVEKVIIQWTLLTEACYFGIQFLVTSITLVEMGTLSIYGLLLLMTEIFFLFITLSYYHYLGRRPKKI
ncbi:hypothetical protein DNTS_001897, partial [Danionella cerebrum]